MNEHLLRLDAHRQLNHLISTGAGAASEYIKLIEQGETIPPAQLSSAILRASGAYELCYLMMSYRAENANLQHANRVLDWAR